VASSYGTRLLLIEGRRRFGLKIDSRRGFITWEAASLRALVGACVRSPKPIATIDTACGRALLYEWIEADPEAALTLDAVDEIRRVLHDVQRSVGGPFPRAEALTLGELLRSARPSPEKEQLTALVQHTSDPFGRGYAIAHGDLWPGNLLTTAAGDLALLDPKLQYAPRCFDLVAYCFHTPAELVPNEMLDDLDAAGPTTRVLGVARELARCPKTPADPWLEWALRGGRTPTGLSTQSGVGAITSNKGPS
jgi:fructosamine-3-kinase